MVRLRKLSFHSGIELELTHGLLILLHGLLIHEDERALVALVARVLLVDQLGESLLI